MIFDRIVQNFAMILTIDLNRSMKRVDTNGLRLPKIHLFKIILHRNKVFDIFSARLFYSKQILPDSFHHNMID